MGDLSQLAGPATSGLRFGHLGLEAVLEYPWIYESDYYQELLLRAKLYAPTPLSSQGERIESYSPVITVLSFPVGCWNTIFAPNLEARTDGQVIFKFRYILGRGDLDQTKLLDDLATGSLEGASVIGAFCRRNTSFRPSNSPWDLPDQRAVPGGLSGHRT